MGLFIIKNIDVNIDVNIDERKTRSPITKFVFAISKK